MNAPTVAAALVKPSLHLLAIESLTPSKTHAQGSRRARFTKEELKVLADDIARNGLIQQPLVRPLGDGKWEIVAGERRWLAAKLAGLKEIYVNVRELGDDQALEMQLSENLQRKDLHELEEAEGYEELMKLKKINADQVAEMIDQSRSYVYGRLKLLALCPEARKAFYAGELDSSRALLIARIGHHDTQRQALADLTTVQGYQRPPATYREAHKLIIERYMLRLKQAPFDVADANLLPKAGTCGACPKRTGNQKDLFGDVKDADVCTDPKCFDDKRQAHYAGGRKKLEAAGKKVIYGDAAKKLFKNWDSPNKWSQDELDRSYVKLDDTTYAAGTGRKVHELLGKDYQPVLIQHPATGQVVSVATQQAVSSAAAVKQRAKKTSAGSSARRSATEPEKPEDRTDEIVGERVLKAVYSKAPTQFGSLTLRILAASMWISVVDICRQDTQRQLGVALGWKIKPSYNHKLPKELIKLSTNDLPRFVAVALAAIDLEGSAVGMDLTPLYKSLKVDRKAIEKTVREELKKAADDAKAKVSQAKLAKLANKFRPTTKKAKGKKK